MVVFISFVKKKLHCCRIKQIQSYVKSILDLIKCRPVAYVEIKLSTFVESRAFLCFFIAK